MFLRFHIFIIIISVSSAVSAQVSLSKKITAWYIENRLKVADANQNGGLSLDEMKAYQSEFAYYFDAKNFKNSDQNQDGEIDKKELNEKFEIETAMRERVEHQQIRSLNIEYGMLSLVNMQYLKKNPDLVVILMQNNSWMEENAFYVQELLKSKSFVKKYPEIISSFNKNLRWLAFNPIKAQKAYRLRTAGTEFPELQIWRDAQTEFVNQNPTVRESVYNTDVSK